MESFLKCFICYICVYILSGYLMNEQIEKNIENKGYYTTWNGIKLIKEMK